jgi:hypothetical protein
MSYIATFSSFSGVTHVQMAMLFPFYRPCYRPQIPGPVTWVHLDRTGEVRLSLDPSNLSPHFVVECCRYLAKLSFLRHSIWVPTYFHDATIDPHAQQRAFLHGGRDACSEHLETLGPLWPTVAECRQVPLFISVTHCPLKKHGLEGGRNWRDFELASRARSSLNHLPQGSQLAGFHLSDIGWKSCKEVIFRLSATEASQIYTWVVRERNVSETLQKTSDQWWWVFLSFFPSCYTNCQNLTFLPDVACDASLERDPQAWIEKTKTTPSIL